jgi:hypothetical protein
MLLLFAASIRRTVTYLDFSLLIELCKSSGKAMMRIKQFDSVQEWNV